ncbi:hypothetical protein D3C80_2153700 [compost metagenome]
MVGNADLADVVQRRRLEEQLDGLLAEEGTETRMIAQMLGQHLDVMRSPADMVAGFVIARLGQ